MVAFGHMEILVSIFFKSLKALKYYLAYIICNRY
jgi:hypothetical protein